MGCGAPPAILGPCPDTVPSGRQVAKAAGPTPEQTPGRRKPRGLARRGCSCPPPVWFDGVDPALLRDDRPPCEFCQRQRDSERKQRDKELRREELEKEEEGQLTRAKTPL